jgi:hypothetical protein
MSDKPIVIRDAQGREHNVRWSGRAAQIFEECAELLDTTTELIMAAHEDGRKITVVYTPGFPADKLIWIALLKRRRDGRLKLVHRERRPGWFEEMEADLEAKLGDAPE